MTVKTTYDGGRKTLRVDSKPGMNFLEVMSDKRGLHVNAWIGGTDPGSREAHYPEDGRWRGIGASLSKDDARALIRYLRQELGDEPEPALCYRGGDLGQSDPKPQVVSACDQSAPKASEVLLDAAREMAKRAKVGYTDGDPGSQALAFAQAANAAKDLETWDRAGFRR